MIFTTKFIHSDVASTFATSYAASDTGSVRSGFTFTGSPTRKCDALIPAPEHSSERVPEGPPSPGYRAGRPRHHGWHVMRLRAGTPARYGRSRAGICFVDPGAGRASILSVKKKRPGSVPFTPAEHRSRSLRNATVIFQHISNEIKYNTARVDLKQKFYYNGNILNPRHI